MNERIQKITDEILAISEEKNALQASLIKSLGLEPDENDSWENNIQDNLYAMIKDAFANIQKIHPGWTQFVYHFNLTISPSFDSGNTVYNLFAADYSNIIEFNISNLDNIKCDFTKFMNHQGIPLKDLHLRFNAVISLLSTINEYLEEYKKTEEDYRDCINDLCKYVQG